MPRRVTLHTVHHEALMLVDTAHHHSSDDSVSSTVDVAVTAKSKLVGDGFSETNQDHDKTLQYVLKSCMKQKPQKGYKSKPLKSKEQRANLVVTFQESLNSFLANPLEHSDIKRMWYRNSDFKKFKAVAKDTARKIINAEREFKEDEDSYTNVLKAFQKACCDDSTSKTTKSPCPKALLCRKDFPTLRNVLRDSSRLGLEKIAVRTLADGKKIRRLEIADSVLELQQEQNEHQLQQQLQQQREPRSGKSKSDDEIKEQQAQAIAKVAESISRPSVLFAIVMAQAYYRPPVALSSSSSSAAAAGLSV